ncbi:hypothetical protein [Polyangium sp. 6x1]|uniref:hypothetical protein n=1 Tax=Polyangium sp. 6x1 TaxID=3042689 RepID=UPI002483298A|nr:hypothetical protein [Polyangium sp. 6x1]MDI1444223.1 hypothetical protein [Polyangium sp. 6x1]
MRNLTALPSLGKAGGVVEVVLPIPLDRVTVIQQQPALLHRRNCEPVTGLRWRRLAALLHKPGCPVRAVVIGGEEHFDTALVLAYLRTLAARPEGEPSEGEVGASPAAEKSTEELQGEMLRGLGYQTPPQPPPSPRPRTRKAAR